MALTDKLSAIGDAIREKTGTTDLLKLDEIPTAISNIESGGGKYTPRYLYRGGRELFSQYTGTELDHETSMLDTSYLTSFYSMFNSCDNLTHLDLSSWNTENVTTLYRMFYYCTNLNTINMNNWDTTNVTEMEGVFSHCTNLQELDLSSWNTENVTDMTQIFFNCRNIKKIDIRNFTFDNVTSYGTMFSNVSSNCLIIVKGETEKEWITSKFTSLKNVKTVAEYQVEGGV